MPRKKQVKQTDSLPVTEMDMPMPMPTEQMPEAADSPEGEAGQPETEQPKNWGDPYKSIRSCPAHGFELGENRRFKQRVFLFKDKPDEAKLSVLKENGFVYGAAEKAWTIPADAASRKFTDELARKWAGPDYVQSVSR